MVRAPAKLVLAFESEARAARHIVPYYHVAGSPWPGSANVSRTIDRHDRRTHSDCYVHQSTVVANQPAATFNQGSHLLDRGLARGKSNLGFKPAHQLRRHLDLNGIAK